MEKQCRQGAALKLGYAEESNASDRDFQNSDDSSPPEELPEDGEQDGTKKAQKHRKGTPHSKAVSWVWLCISGPYDGPTSVKQGRPSTAKDKEKDNMYWLCKLHDIAGNKFFLLK